MWAIFDKRNGSINYFGLKADAKDNLYWLNKQHYVLERCPSKRGEPEAYAAWLTYMHLKYTST